MGIIIKDKKDGRIGRELTKGEIKPDVQMGKAPL